MVVNKVLLAHGPAVGLVLTLSLVLQWHCGLLQMKLAGRVSRTFLHMLSVLIPACLKDVGQESCRMPQNLYMAVFLGWFSGEML